MLDKYRRRAPDQCGLGVPLEHYVVCTLRGLRVNCRGDPIEIELIQRIIETEKKTIADGLVDRYEYESQGHCILNGTKAHSSVPIYLTCDLSREMENLFVLPSQQDNNVHTNRPEIKK